MTWIVGITQIAKESWAQTNVNRHGLQTYLPRFREEYLGRDKSVQTRDAFLFPRYLFIDIDSSWYFLYETFGMSGIVMEGDHPAPVPSCVLEELKRREDDHGYVQLPRRLARRYKPAHYYRKGQKVRVVIGPLVGYSGVCLGDSAKARVWVLLRYLGTQTRVLVARDALIAA